MMPTSEGKRSTSGKHPVLSFLCNYSGQPLRFGVALFHPGIFTNRPLFLSVLTTLILQLAAIYVPILNPIFRTQPLNAGELGLVLALSSIVFFAVETEKLLRRTRAKEKGA